MTARRPFDLVVFDFDGTLVDSHEGIVAAVNGALQAAGLPVRTAEAIGPHIGRPLLDVIRALLPTGVDAALVERVRQAYRALYFEVAPALTRPFVGVPEGLAALKAAGVRLAVASNKSRHGLDLMIEHVDLRSTFDVVVAADEVPSPKPHPAMLHAILEHLPTALDRVAVVGDSRADVGLGRAVGVVTVGVTWGAQTREVLEAEGATWVVDSVGELLSRLGGPSAPPPACGARASRSVRPSGPRR
jgi:phosphoglycolate phosphatase